MSRWVGVEQSPTTHPQAVFAFFVEDFWPPGPSSEVIGNSAFLRPNGDGPAQ